MVPMFQKKHHFKSNQIIVGFLLNSGISENEELKLKIKASYIPSETENKLRNLQLNSEIPKKSKTYGVILGESDEELV